MATRKPKMYGFVTQKSTIFKQNGIFQAVGDSEIGPNALCSSIGIPKSSQMQNDSKNIQDGHSKAKNVWARY